MEITAQRIEAAAPDQASLKAAAKLLKPGTWTGHGTDPATGLFWGECQGSGATPYRVAADPRDLGAKCSCPSRKFPCKHALALMFQRAQGAGFAPAPLPDWAAQWLSRRRVKPEGAAAEAGEEAAPSGPARGAPPGALAAALAAEARAAAAPPPPEDPAAAAKREAARLKREAQTAAAIRAGLDELEGWVADRLREGLPALLAELRPRFRALAARMTDAKAPALAARIDEAPARILALPAPLRAEAAAGELAGLILLSRGWGDGTAPLPELRRAVFRAEPREALLADPAAPSHRAVWEVLRVTERAGADGLIARAVWLARRGEDAAAPGSGAAVAGAEAGTGIAALAAAAAATASDAAVAPEAAVAPAVASAGAAAPRFALLLDHAPPGAGRAPSAFAAGQLIDATLRFHPARDPLRAVVEARHDDPAPGAVPPRAAAPADPPSAWRAALRAEPWRLSHPIALPPGRLAWDAAGAAWWRSEALSLPLAPPAPCAAAFGLALTGGAVLWNGVRAEPLAFFAGETLVTADG